MITQNILESTRNDYTKYLGKYEEYSNKISRKLLGMITPNI